MKETEIKNSSLSLILKPGNKILVSLIISSLSEKKRTQNKDGRDLITTSTLMTTITNTQSFQCRETKHAYR